MIHGPVRPALAERITFVVIAQDEQANIVDCLNSTRAVLGSTSLVVDGGSVDDTCALAESLGARVAHREFDNAANQYIFGMSLVETPWVFILDADERLDDELAGAINREDLDRTDAAAYRVRRRNFFVNQWVEHGAWYPDVNTRLLRVGLSQYEQRAVHARIVSQGPVRDLPGHILHYTYTSVSQYITKLNKFTNREVQARKQDHETRDRHGSEFKSTLRKMWLNTPGKPVSRFIVDYVLRGGFKDGRVGLDIAVSSAYYEYVVGMKQRYDEGTPSAWEKT